MKRVAVEISMVFALLCVDSGQNSHLDTGFALFMGENFETFK